MNLLMVLNNWKNFVRLAGKYKFFEILLLIRELIKFGKIITVKCWN
jgi:hypothetical protein